MKQELNRYLRNGRGLRRKRKEGGAAEERNREHGQHLGAAGGGEDCDVTGSWEGDLINGAGNLSAIGTLVERHSNFTMLVHLPDGYKPDQVAPALTRKIQQLPVQLRGALTGDQGPEMRDWDQVRIDTGIELCRSRIGET